MQRKAYALLYLSAETCGDICLPFCAVLPYFLKRQSIIFGIITIEKTSPL